MRQIVCVLLFFFTFTSIRANFWSFYSDMHLRNIFDMQLDYYNPAFTASEGRMKVSSLYALQKIWSETNFNVMNSFAFNTKLSARKSIGMGVLNAYQQMRLDKSNGSNSNDNRFNLSYNYKAKNYSLGFGSYLSYTTYSAIYQWDNVHGNEYYSDKQYGLNAGMGLRFELIQSKTYFGFSSMNLLSQNYEYKDALTQTDKTIKTRQREFYLTTGSQIPISQRFVFKPDVLLFARSTVGTILNLNLVYQSKFLAGISYNSFSDAPGWRLGYTMPRYKVHYNYESFYYAAGRVANFAGIHSLGIQYTFAEKE